MASQEIVLRNMEETFASLSISRHPSEVLAEAAKAANALNEVIAKKPKQVTFNGKKYLENEDWITLARFYGVTSRIKNTTFVEFGEGEVKVRGWEATAEAYRESTGQVIATADSMCLNDEENWGLRPKYEWVDGKRKQSGLIPVPLFQLRSMAQTRASSKVLSMVFKWVVVLGGFQPTPAEEMDENVIEGDSQGQQIRRPQRKEAAKTEEPKPRDPECISEAQGKRMYAICKQLKLSDDEIKAEMRRLLKDKAGNPLEHSRDMLKKDYEGFIDSVDPQFKHHDKPKAAAGGDSGKYDRENF